MFLRAVLGRSRGRDQWRGLPLGGLLVAVAIIAALESQDLPTAEFFVEGALTVSSAVVAATLAAITFLGLRELVRTMFSGAWRRLYWRGFGLRHMLIFTAAVGFTCTVRRSLTDGELPVEYLVGLFTVLLLTWLVIHCAIVDFGPDQEPARDAARELADASPWSELPILGASSAERPDVLAPRQAPSRFRWWWARRNQSSGASQTARRGGQGNRCAIRRKPGA